MSLDHSIVVNFPEVLRLIDVRANQPRYARIMDAAGGKPVPEARLPPMVRKALTSLSLYQSRLDAVNTEPWVMSTNERTNLTQHRLLADFCLSSACFGLAGRPTLAYPGYLQFLLLLSSALDSTLSSSSVSTFWLTAMGYTPLVQYPQTHFCDLFWLRVCPWLPNLCSTTLE